MSTCLTVSPERFVVPTKYLPLTGRGAWTREGIGSSAAYHYKAVGRKVGNEAETVGLPGGARMGRLRASMNATLRLSMPR